MRSTSTASWKADRGRVTAIAADLVGITSVNPSLGGQPGGERRVAEYIGEVCGAIGCEVVFDEVLPQRPLAVAARAATGHARAAGLRAGTDASKFARAGVPAVVLGPGSLDQAHTDDEWIDLEEIARAAEIYVDFCREFAAA
jgi:acetylornithine deacetylase/succinyl-diaminopimelate desuccinylase-like protein